MTQITLPQPAAPNSPTPPRRPTDPRTAFARAVDTAGHALAAVRADQLGDPTPCDDYDVRLLAAHMVAILRRVVFVGRGGDPLRLPNLANDVSDGFFGLIVAWEAAALDAETVWSRSELLDTPVRLPFGTLPGAAALGVYTTEITIHTWDLVTATSQQPRWHSDVLAACVATMGQAVPAEPRGGHVPFGPVVGVAPDAPAVDRLVAWYGRRP